MSKLSIYENKWTDLVFENKNKEYGAYQLRQENPRTTVTALFMALLLITAFGSISMLISKFSTHDVVESEPVIYDPTITVVDIDTKVKPPTVEPITPPAQQAAATAPITAAQLTNPVVARTEDAVEEIAVNTQNTPVVENTTATGTATNVLPSNGGGGTGTATTEVVSNEPVNSGILDKLPEFPGGINKFYTYVGNNFTKPDLDAERTLRVYVSFVIERDGTMTDIVVKNDPGFGMGKEAIRVLKSLKTKWTPGILDGKAVRTAYNLPITIKTEAD